MTLWTWPAELPQRPLPDNFSDTLPDLDIASQPDIGPAKVRRETTAGVYQINPVYKVNDWQKERVKRFHDRDVLGRTSTWWLPEPGLDGYPLLDENAEVLTDEAGDPLLMSSLLLVRFVTPPDFQPQARPKLGWTCMLPLEVLP